MVQKNLFSKKSGISKTEETLMLNRFNKTSAMDGSQLTERR